MARPVRGIERQGRPKLEGPGRRLVSPLVLYAEDCERISGEELDHRIRASILGSDSRQITADRTIPLYEQQCDVRVQKGAQ